MESRNAGFTLVLPGPGTTAPSIWMLECLHSPHSPATPLPLPSNEDTTMLLVRMETESTADGARWFRAYYVILRESTEVSDVL